MECPAGLSRPFERQPPHPLSTSPSAHSQWLMMVLPPGVRMLSGWNCTPHTSRVRWRKAMIAPSADNAVISKHAGNVSRSTTHEW